MESRNINWKELESSFQPSVQASNFCMSETQREACNSPDFIKARSWNCDLPPLAIDQDSEPLCHRDVGKIIDGVIWLLERDRSYGCPSRSAGQYHESVGPDGRLLDAVDFPNNNQTLNIDYIDRTSKKISQISMNGRQVSFSYDGDLLNQISYAGPPGKEPLILSPHEEDFRLAKSGNQIIKCDVADLAREICDFLRS